MYLFIKQACGTSLNVKIYACGVRSYPVNLNTNKPCLTNNAAIKRLHLLIQHKFTIEPELHKSNM